MSRAVCYATLLTPENLVRLILIIKVSCVDTTVQAPLVSELGLLFWRLLQIGDRVSYFGLLGMRPGVRGLLFDHRS